MESTFCTLQALIEALCMGTRVHVCVHDVEGALCEGPLWLPHVYRMHASRLCDLAKATPRGFAACMRCKTYANRKAVREGAPFAGYCSSGLYEIVRPVRFDGAVVCIIYVGNLLREEAEALRRVQWSARRAGTDAAAMTEALCEAQRADMLAPYVRIADALESYILLFLAQTGWRKSKSPFSDCRRKARDIREYIDVNFRRDLSLRQLAALYFVNEKYLGRIFQAETGLSMRQYLNQVRLSHAAQLLADTQEPVLHIALDCGFQNISYFNRQFMARYACTPLQYRRTARNSSGQA